MRLESLVKYTHTPTLMQTFHRKLRATNRKNKSLRRFFRLDAPHYDNLYPGETEAGGTDWANSIRPGQVR